jgi:hypothetical protein
VFIAVRAPLQSIATRVISAEIGTQRTGQPTAARGRSCARGLESRRQAEAMTDLFADIDPQPRPWTASGAPWVRRIVFVLFVVFIAAALANEFGQEATRSASAAPAARLSVTAPEVLRGGLLAQARIEIEARSAIEHPQLVLGEGWFEGMQVSSIEPQPAAEAGQGREVSLSYDPLDAGQTLTVWVQLQVDPTRVGRRPADVRLQDGKTTIATISRTMTVLP